MHVQTKQIWSLSLAQDDDFKWINSSNASASV